MEQVEWSKIFDDLRAALTEAMADGPTRRDPAGKRSDERAAKFIFLGVDALALIADRLDRIVVALERNAEPVDATIDQARGIIEQTRTLSKVKAFLEDELYSALAGCCALHPDGAPDTTKIDEPSRPMIAGIEEILNEVRAALGEPPKASVL